MFRSTETAAQSDQGGQTVSADGVATPYFMLIQMNNAALLEAYETLGIAPVAAKVESQKFPDNFNLASAFAPTLRGAADMAEHPGEAYADGTDPIKEAESETHGSADNALTLAGKIAGRFSDMTSDGGDFGAMIENALTMAKLPGVDFDADIVSTGASILGVSQEISSCMPDNAGQSPFTGFRADYRPKTAPDGPEVKNRRNLPSSPAVFLGTLLARNI